MAVMHDLCNSDACERCGCEEVEWAEHCRHCYHDCALCSTAVNRGCRICAFSPDKSKYLSWAGGKLRNEYTPVSSPSLEPQSPGINPVSPIEWDSDAENGDTKMHTAP